jgi:hypothetical protein
MADQVEVVDSVTACGIPGVYTARATCHYSFLCELKS